MSPLTTQNILVYRQTPRVRNRAFISIIKTGLVMNWLAFLNTRRVFTNMSLWAKGCCPDNIEGLHWTTVCMEGGGLKKTIQLVLFPQSKTLLSELKLDFIEMIKGWLKSLLVKCYCSCAKTLFKRLNLIIFWEISYSLYINITNQTYRPIRY